MKKQSLFLDALEKIIRVPAWVWFVIFLFVLAIDVSLNPECCTPGSFSDGGVSYGLNPNLGD